MIGHEFEMIKILGLRIQENLSQESKWRIKKIDCLTTTNLY